MNTASSPVRNEKMAKAGLVVVINETVRDPVRLFFVVRLLRRRFGFTVVLAFKTPELLFFDQRVLRWVARRDDVDRVFISSEGDALWADVVEFAKRLDTQYVLLTRSGNLCDEWLDLLRFIVEALHGGDQFFESRSRQFLWVEQRLLRTRELGCVGSYAELSLGLSGEVFRDKEKINLGTTSNSSLYITVEGLNRFGGYARFLASPLKIGGREPKEYRHIWAINNKLSLDEFCRRSVGDLKAGDPIEIPGYLGPERADPLIVDIYPGRGLGIEDHASGYGIPRMNLNIGIARGIKIRQADNEAVFAMSNFNKARYIVAALYGIALQTYEACSVHIIDDASTDESIKVIEEFSRLIDAIHLPIVLERNQSNKGTYWIRNSIVHRNIETESIYLVNDSDDFSTSQRATIQMSMFEDMGSAPVVCFGDVVRVAGDFRVLAVDSQVERYGTASLACRAKSHQKSGYYENIKKNGDTEFIERLRFFAGRGSVRWFRVPVLFQPFDGTNLTSDIYMVDDSGTGLKSDLSVRSGHRKQFMEGYQKTKTSLADRFPFEPAVAPTN